MPEGKEMVSIRPRQRAVLEHFQEDGPGWQDRINAARLRYSYRRGDFRSVIPEQSE
jgi:uncharacterized protein (DUF4415 family)